MRLALLGMVACTGKTSTTPTADTGADTEVPDSGTLPGDSADTGISTEVLCPPDVLPLAIEVCAESTVGLYTGYDVELSGTALVTELGGALEAVPGSLVLPGFEACDATFPYQVRLVDQAGDVWTFGWEIEGEIDAESTKALLAGTDLSFFVSVGGDAKAGHALALLLADEVGPVLLYESRLQLTEQVRGFVAERNFDAPCVLIPGGSTEHFGVTYAWAEGSVTLQSGQLAVVPLPGRDLSLLQASAYEQTSCDDSCTSLESMGWAEQ